jgi:spore maturation protein CgeB
MHENGTEASRSLLPLRGPLRRVLFFGKNMSRSRCTAALVEALRAHGLQVKWVNFATRRRWLGEKRALASLRAVRARFRPDLIFVFLRDLPRPLLAEFRNMVPVVNWVEDALENLDATHIEYMREAHLVCMSNPAIFPRLREHGVGELLFLMSGFSPTFHHPIARRRYERDVAFIGGPGKRGQRAEFVSEIARRFSTDVFGRQWDDATTAHPHLRLRGCVKPRGYRRVCATSRVVLGLNEVNDDPYYFSNRTWLSLGCGAFHLTHYVPGLEEVFGNHEHLVWYHGLEECLELLEHYVARDAERERIARAGHTLAVGQHRYHHRVARILESLRAERSAPARALALPKMTGAGSGRLSPSRAD